MQFWREEKCLNKAELYLIDNRSNIPFKSKEMPFNLFVTTDIANQWTYMVLLYCKALYMPKKLVFINLYCVKVIQLS